MEKHVAESEEGREPIGTLGNGAEVFVDPTHSHAATHLRENPELPKLIREALPLITSPKEGNNEVDLGRTVGNSTLVETSGKDDIFYARRPNRDRYTRFVKNRDTVPVSTLVVRLVKKSDNEYELFTAYVGKDVPEFPASEADSEEVTFWDNHALVFDNQEIVSGTITSACPWKRY